MGNRWAIFFCKKFVKRLVGNLNTVIFVTSNGLNDSPEFLTIKNEFTMSNFSSSQLAPIAADVSQKYVVINSEILVNELQARGFILRDIKRSKSGSRVHTVRMRTDTPIKVKGETLYPEIVIRNSYDKTCAFSVETGIFRLVCSNGLTVRVKGSAGQFFKTRHIGSEALIVSQIALEFSENIDKVWEVQKFLTEKKLTDDQMIKLAMRAATLRWRKVFTPEEAKVLLTVARPEDKGNSAWVTFNVLQEHILNGGDKLGDMKKTPRPINKAKDHANLNEWLFDSVYEMATEGEFSPMPFAMASDN